MTNTQTSKTGIRGPQLKSTAEDRRDERRLLIGQGMRNRRNDPWKM